MICRAKTNVFLAVALCALIAGCGGGEGPGPEPVTYEGKVAAGWQFFTQSQYHEALTEFYAALEIDTFPPDAYSGLGWSYALLDSLQYAQGAFFNAISSESTHVDAYVGMAAVTADIPHYCNLSIHYASQALVLDPDFVFEHRASYDWRDVHLILAECFYSTAEYDSALAHARALDPELDLDPQAEDYLELLLLKIEELVAVHGGF
jgi:tetratricopeptide (TPR) repeat protein